MVVVLAFVKVVRCFEATKPPITAVTIALYTCYVSLVTYIVVFDYVRVCFYFFNNAVKMYTPEKVYTCF